MRLCVSTFVSTSTLRLAAILNFVKKRLFHSGETLEFFQILKADTLVIYKFKILYVSQILMTLDLLPIKP